MPTIPSEVRDGDNQSRITHKANAVIFDGDDTLWETQPLYDAAKRDFASLLHQEGIEYRGDVVALLDEIDAEQVSSEGFSKGRFARSMLHTYERLCRIQGVEPKEDVKAKLRSIGLSVFENVPMLYPDVIEALIVLRPTHTLVLATKGDPDVQLCRISSLGVGSYFDKVCILDRKTEAEYLTIVRDIGVSDSRVWVVGNSIKSDINPAIRAGLRAIWIPRGHWAYEIEEREPQPIFTVDSIADAVSIIREDGRVYVQH